MYKKKSLWGKLLFVIYSLMLVLGMVYGTYLSEAYVVSGKYVDVKNNYAIELESAHQSFHLNCADSSKESYRAIFKWLYSIHIRNKILTEYSFDDPSIFPCFIKDCKSLDVKKESIFLGKLNYLVYDGSKIMVSNFSLYWLFIILLLCCVGICFCTNNKITNFFEGFFNVIIHNLNLVVIGQVFVVFVIIKYLL